MAQLPSVDKIYTPNQLEMIESQKNLVKQNREAFRNSLSEEQKKHTQKQFTFPKRKTTGVDENPVLFSKRGTQRQSRIP